MSIVRLTRAGTLQLNDEPFQARCAPCGARPAGDRAAAPVGLIVTVTGGPTLRTSICADCLSEALAILFGRRHVQHGGQVGDLQVPEPEGTG